MIIKIHTRLMNAILATMFHACILVILILQTHAQLIILITFLAQIIMLSEISMIIIKIHARLMNAIMATMFHACVLVILILQTHTQLIILITFLARIIILSVISMIQALSIMIHALSIMISPP